MTAAVAVGYSLFLLAIGYLLGRYRRLLPWRREFAQQNLPDILRYVEEVEGSVEALRQQLKSLPDAEILTRAAALHEAADDLPASYYTVLTRSADPFIFDTLPELREQLTAFVRSVECYARAHRDGQPYSTTDMDGIAATIRRLARQISKQARRVALVK